jgi:hypothetical protein
MSTLSAGEHDDEVNLVAIFYRSDEFIRVDAGMI